MTLTWKRAATSSLAGGADEDVFVLHGADVVILLEVSDASVTFPQATTLTVKLIARVDAAGHSPA